MRKQTHNEYIWVQCEDPMCMKWRKIPKDHCDDLSAITWFCHMNPDENYNTCENSQEAIHVEKGKTLVCSELECGLLVWAKMAGFPRLASLQKKRKKSFCFKNLFLVLY